MNDAAHTSQWSLESSFKDEADMLDTLEYAIEEGDERLVAATLGLIAKKRGMTKVAKASGLGREGLYKALSFNGNPEFSTIMKVMTALGLHLKVERADAAVRV